MNRHLAIAVLAALAIGGGYLGYRSLGGSTSLAAYADRNVQMGAVQEPTTACGVAPTHPTLVCLADLLKADLSPELLASLQRPYSVDEAKLWSNFPPMGFQDRVGPTLGDFTPEQLGLIKSILRVATGISGNEGFDEIEQILNADDYLIAQTGEAGFSSSNYHLSFLGTPAATGTWQLYFGGHHFALTNTYKDGTLVGATPAFRGVEPFTPFAQNGRDNAPMLQEQAAFAALLGALSPEEQAKATLASALGNILAGPQQDANIPAAPEGLRLGDTSPQVQALALAAIETYVSDMAAADAEAIMARYGAEIGETYVSFSGTPTTNAEGDYVRIDGPSVWVELSMQAGRSLEGIHPHSVWRDKGADYGGHIH